MLDLDLDLDLLSVLVTLACYQRPSALLLGSSGPCWSRCLGCSPFLLPLPLLLLLQSSGPAGATQRADEAQPPAQGNCRSATWTS